MMNGSGGMSGSGQGQFMKKDDMYGKRSPMNGSGGYMSGSQNGMKKPPMNGSGGQWT